MRENTMQLHLFVHNPDQWERGETGIGHIYVSDKVRVVLHFDSKEELGKFAAKMQELYDNSN